MRLSDFPILADENIHSDVVVFMRSVGIDVLAVTEAGMSGAPDLALLRRAYSEGRVVVTHDSDFGTLAVAGGEPVVGGVVYLRPGHIDAQFSIASLRAVLDSNIDFIVPFVLVAHRVDEVITMRLRRVERA